MKYLSIILLSILTLLSCTSDELVNMHVSDVEFTLAATTRSNEKFEFVEGDAVGVYVLDRATGSTLKSVGNYADNRKFIWNKEKEAFVAADNDNLIFNSPDRQLDFYVYFPYLPQVISATSLPHVITGSSKTDDFLYALNSDRSGNKAIPLVFHHLLSKVNVIYSSTENRANTAMTIHTYTDGKVDLSTGKLTTTANRRIDLPLEKVDGVDYVSFIGLVPPQVWKVGEKFSLLSYTDQGTAYPFSFAKERKFVSGEENEVKFMPKELTYKFIASPSSLSFAALDASKKRITVTSEKSDAINGVILPNTTFSLEYSLSNKPDWVTISGNDVFVTENRVSVQRSGTVTFTQEESNLPATITIQQAAGVTTYNYVFNFNDGSTSKSWTNVAATGGSQNYTISSLKETLVNGVKDNSEEVSYSGSSNVGWITVSGGKITIAENQTTYYRSGVATFMQPSSGKTITVSIQQKAGVITYGDWDISVSARPLNIAAGGGSSSISCSAKRNVYTNGKYNGYQGGTPTLSASGSGFSLSGTTLTASSNTSTLSRECTVTASYGGVSNSCTVSQSGSTPTPDPTPDPTPTITYGPWNISVNANPTTIASSGGSSSISRSAIRDVYTNGVKTSTETGTPSLSASGSGFSLSGTTLTASNNTSTSSRRCTVTASYGGVSNSCTVSQSGSTPTPDPTPDPTPTTTYEYTFSFSDGSTSKSWTSISAAGASNSYSIISTKHTLVNGVIQSSTSQSYSASSPSWASASGSTINVAENNNTTPRGDTVTFTQEGSGNTITVTLLQLKKSSVDIN